MFFVKPGINFENAYMIHPLQQNKIQDLLTDILTNNIVSSIYIFGSSVTKKCKITSDVDIYVESSCDIRLQKFHNFSYDLWTNFSANEKLKKEILSTGVKIYG